MGIQVNYVGRIRRRDRWTPKKVQVHVIPKKGANTAQIDQEGFQHVGRRKSIPKKPAREEAIQVTNENGFDALTIEPEAMQEQEKEVIEHWDEIGVGWGVPLLGMDNLLIWNVKGLNSINKQIKVRQLISSHKLQLFSLPETRVKAPNLGRVYLNLCP